MVGKGVSPELTPDDSLSYIASMKKIYHNEEPVKYVKFNELFNLLKAHRVEELMKEHLGFGVVLLSEDKMNISPEAEQYAESSYYTKRKRGDSDGPGFMNKLKTRFRSLDTHVVESFRELTKKFEEGKRSKKELHGEVVDLLYYHEDLLDHFNRLLLKE